MNTKKGNETKTQTEMKTNTREYIKFGKICATKKRNLAVSMSMFGDDENVDASVGGLGG